MKYMLLSTLEYHANTNASKYHGISIGYHDCNMVLQYNNICQAFSVLKDAVDCC